jgi:hypothetical protein
MFVRIYALAVCFASVLCITISLGVGLFDVVQLTYPKITMNSYEYQNLQSNESFRQSRGSPYAMVRGGVAQPLFLREGGAAAYAEKADPVTLSDTEITRLREERMQLLINNIRHDATRSLIQILIILLVTLPLFALHWRLAQRLDER